MINRSLNFGDHCRMSGSFFERHFGVQIMILQPRGKHLGIECNQRRDKGLLIPDCHDLTDEWEGADRILQSGGSNVLPTGRHDDFLLASGDGEIPV